MAVLNRDYFIYILVVVLVAILAYRIGRIDEKVAALEDIVFVHGVYKQIGKR